MTSLVLVAPMEGWSAPLDEVPDAVFADRLLGDGVAIDPTGNALFAPCDGEVISIPAQHHAITLRAPNGAQVLMHVGVDTVALGGEGFELHVDVGSKVRAGDRLLTFDLDLLAQRAKSLLTPIIITDEAPFSIARRVTSRSLSVGDVLMELTPANASQRTSRGENGHSAVSLPSTRQGDIAATSSAGATPLSAHLKVSLEHGLHARPAALLVARLKNLAATVTVTAHGKSANARSAIALMSLGIRKNDDLTLTSVGPDAAAALAAAQGTLHSVAEPHATVARDSATSSPQSPRARAKEPTRAASDERAGVIRGVVASPGLAVGVAKRLARAEFDVAEAGAGVAHENQRLDAALAAVRAELRAAVAKERGPGREVLTAHLEFLDDPELVASARASIEQSKSAGFAWRRAIRAHVEVLRALPDARLAERADDLLDLETQVLTALEGDRRVARGAAEGAPAQSDSQNAASRIIVLADELLPSQFVSLDVSHVAGICLAGGGPTSHVAILAAAANIPMVVAAGPSIREIADGTALILDADRGELRVDPAADERASAESKVAQRRSKVAAEREAAQRECRTADGVRIEIFANVGSVEDARTAVTQGAEGCGLLRTEFLFLDRDVAPDEATQAAMYSGIVQAFEGRPVVIRTLDAGGDKPLAYMPLPTEENPALGVRGVRISQLHPNVLRSQIRAIVSAQPSGHARILLPMISGPAEVRAIGEMLDEIRGELRHDAPVPLGAMIETPAAAMLADEIAKEADFLSIGTNDLTQYALAIDRGNPLLASQLDSLHPSVLRLIAHAARGARANYRDIAVCGSLASDPTAAPILIGLGINELSAVPAMVPRLKALIASVTLKSCEALAREALEQTTAAQVRVLSSRWLRDVAEPAQ